ncbi:hypothetical protein GGD63_003469 [Bradyrhizobium sp. cir1]|nr:hypothetical protein [Bradyrhizobium sp. cir1]
MSVVLLIARDEQVDRGYVVCGSVVGYIVIHMAGARRMPLEACTRLKTAREMLQASAKKTCSIAEKTARPRRGLRAYAPRCPKTKHIKVEMLGVRSDL